MQLLYCYIYLISFILIYIINIKLLYLNYSIDESLIKYYILNQFFYFSNKY